jgi:hypothetical protein
MTAFSVLYIKRDQQRISLCLRTVLFWSLHWMIFFPFIARWLTITVGFGFFNGTKILSSLATKDSSPRVTILVRPW